MDYQYLKWSGMAIDASFGLEYVLIGNKEKSDKLIQEGILLCQLLEVVMTDSTPINQHSLESYHVHKSLTSNPQELEQIVKKANETKIFLQSILDGYKPSEQEIREYQHFFNELSTPWLSKEYNQSIRRRGCF